MLLVSVSRASRFVGVFWSPKVNSPSKWAPTIVVNGVVASISRVITYNGL